MEKYDVTGMSCAACQAHVEKAVSKVPGVKTCNVSLLTNSMTVEGTAGSAEIIKAVEDAGYGASVHGGSDAGKTTDRLKADEEALEDKETPKLVKRLISSVIVLLILMYFSMGHMMWSFPVPPILENAVNLGILEMILALVVLFINRKFFISGTKGIIHGAPNMDTLVALGAADSFFYSLVALFLMADAMGKGDSMTVMNLSMKHLWFETSAMIPTLITIGKTLESYSKGRTTDALKSLMKLAPETAVLVRDGKEETVPIGEVKTGDIFVVRPGESIPVDGEIIEGASAINEAALTGESVPVDKEIGDTVSAATINTSGFIKCKATRVGEDTTLSQIIKMVSDAAATKAPLARIADKVSAVFVPAVLLIAAATFIGWMIVRLDIGFAMARAVSVLVISCPCALGLATPVAIMVGNGVGAKNGILYKTAASLEATGRTEIVALDKTGTITNGTPIVTDIIPADGISEDELITLAAGLEAKSEHPLAKAITGYAAENNIATKEALDFNALPGNGLTAKLDGSEVFGGSEKFISTKCDVDNEMKNKSAKLAADGKTPLFFTKDGRLIGIIAVADTIKSDSAEAIRQLKNMGIRTVMLTGDNERTANAVGMLAGVDQVIAGVLPSGKENVVKELMKQGKTAMIGDGINDAPALTAADTGIAIGAGADVAVDAADVVLMKGSLLNAAAAIRMSRATIKNIHENLFWAFFYNAICIPLAIGLYQALFHADWELSPAIGALAMSFSSVTVCLNALRLNLFKIYDSSHDKKIAHKKSTEKINIYSDENNTNQIKETEKMTKTITIEGMMCNHCEATVKKALEGLDGVTSADVSHEKGTAVVELIKDVPEADLKKAIEDKDYKFISVA